MKSKLQIAASITLVFCAVESKAQLAVGATAPDFTLTDLKGASHKLYTYLDAGKTMFIDINATWCAPCWAYHKGGILDLFYTTFGPEGTNKGMVLMIEADAATNTACLSGSAGCVGGTQGNWLEGTHHPVVDIPSTQVSAFSSAWRVGSFPTIYTICPDRKIASVGQQTAAQLGAIMTKCAGASSVLGGDIHSRVSVGPDISSGRMHVDVNADALSQVQVDVYDAAGAVIFAGNAQGSHTFKFDMAAQPNGLYYFQVKVAGKSIIRKIVLNK